MIFRSEAEENCIEACVGGQNSILKTRSPFDTPEPPFHSGSATQADLKHVRKPVMLNDATLGALYRNMSVVARKAGNAE